MADDQDEAQTYLTKSTIARSFTTSTHDVLFHSRCAQVCISVDVETVVVFAVLASGFLMYRPTTTPAAPPDMDGYDESDLHTRVCHGRR
jgi:hypothetical protein